MAKSEVLQVRLNVDELEDWRQAAALASRNLSPYVHRAVASRVKLEQTLREETEQLDEQVRMRRLAAMKLPEYEHGRP